MKKACRLRAYSCVWSARVVMSVCIVKGRYFVGLIQGVFHGKINTEVVYPDLLLMASMVSALMHPDS
jgi:hypothetical protein